MVKDTIKIKYDIPKLHFNVTPSGNQRYDLHYRITSDVQDISGEGWRTAGEYITNNEGENVNNKQLVDLIDGATYQLKFTNKISKETFFTYFTAYENTSVGDSPYYDKVLFPNQTFSWLYEGAEDLSLPGMVPLQWYYSLMGSKAITVEPDAYYSCEIYNEDSWEFGTTKDILSENYQGFSCDGFNALRLPFTGSNRDACHTAEDVFFKPYGSNYKNVFGFSFFLKDNYVNADLLTLRRKSNTTKIENILEYIELWSIRVHPSDLSKIQVVKWDKTSDTETVIETLTLSKGLILSKNKWYNLQFLDAKTIRFYDNEGKYISEIILSDNPYFGRGTGQSIKPLWNTDSPIIFGNPLGKTKGLLINRVFNSYELTYDSEDNITSEEILKITSSYLFKPYPAYYKGDTLLYKDTIDAVAKTTNSEVAIIVRPNIIELGVPEGEVDVKLLFGVNESILDTKKLIIKSVTKTVDHVGFDMDFVKDYSGAMQMLKEKFYTKHGTWGGYNGGVNSHMIYGNGKDALVMENHGDLYDGEVNGVSKETTKADYDGYGGTAYYDAFNDAKKGQPFKTRVGSVLVSDQYFPFGEMTVRMLIPAKTYGICPALWFFHYQEYGDSDPRYKYWTDKGFPKQGNEEDGFYTVVNNEIDIELPSHNIQGSFKDWNEVASAYFDPKALDTQYQIGLDQTSTNMDYKKVGTFRLKNVNNPNDFESWEQVDYEYKTRIYPNFSSIKFNNWIGEYDSGNGWGKTEEEYKKKETYLALLTKVKDFEDTYADNKYHDYTIKWYPDRTELWIDGVYIRSNRAFVPFNVMKYTLGGWFPSMPRKKVVIDEETGETRWEVRDTDNGGVLVAPNVDPVGTWAGINADFEICHFLVNRITFKPFKDVDSSGLQFEGENFPESGLRYIL